MTEHGIHAVRFYQDSDSLCRMAGNYLAEGLLDGEPAIIIATREHREGFAAHLAERGLDVPALIADGDLVLLDAEATLARFMRDGMPDPILFARAIAPIIEAAGRRERNPQRRAPRAYGEMVDLLWRAGKPQSARRLEILWNNLARTQPFSLLCGYAIDSLYREGDVDDICSHHSHVLSEHGEITGLT